MSVVLWHFWTTGEWKPPPPPVPPEYNIHLSKQYIKMLVLVKRNGKVVHYCTSYIPFGTERAIQP